LGDVAIEIYDVAAVIRSPDHQNTRVMEEKNMSHKESLELITTMINKAKQSFYDTGISAIMWGGVIAFCSLEKLAELQFGYSLPFDIFMLTFVAVIPQIVLNIREQKVRTVKTHDEHYLDYVWVGFGISVFLMVFITNSIYAHLEPVIRHYNEIGKSRTDWTDFQFGEYTISLYLLLYGIPTFITGAACKFKPMLWGAVICWISCIAALFTPIKIDLIMMAVSAIMAWLIPGIIMRKEFSEYKNQQAALHV
jgi:hypothetical protein